MSQWRCRPLALVSLPWLRWCCCPCRAGIGSHVIALVAKALWPTCEGAVAHIDAIHLCTGQVVIRRLPLLRWWRQLLWRSLHCCPRRDGAVAHVALASSSFPCCARREGPEGPLLRPRRCCATIALPATRRYSVAATPTSNAVAVASPLHRRCAVVVLMQRQLMLGARARHRRSRPCWRTRFLCLRSSHHCVVVTSLWSRLSDHCCCRGHITVALLSRRRSHTAVGFAPRRRRIVV